ncbi:MAG: sugar ABC transporter permease [Actinomycetes bacterium]
MATKTAVAPTGHRARRWDRDRLLPYLLLIPAGLALALVSAYPIYEGVRASLTQYLYGRAHGSAGLKNYTDVMHDSTFWTAMGVTTKFVFICVVVETLLGLGLALLVVKEVKGIKFIRMSILAPMTVAPVVVGVIWRLIFSSETGFVDPVFTALGLGAPRMLTHEATAFWGLVMVDVWEWTPLLFLICLAGLQGLPQEPLEAATVDGAGPIRVFFNHTLPLLIPVLAVGIILRLIDAIGTFDQIFVLTRGGPGTATQLISIYAYNTAFNFTDYGHGAAMLIALLVFVFLLVLVAVSLMRRAARKSA